jgi:DNA-binding NarL/FixJ family response regulator
MSAEGIRVAIADDDESFRAEVQALLNSIPDVDFVAEAADADGAVRISVTEAPQVLLLDIRAPGVDGVQSVSRIRTAAPQVAIVVLTSVDDGDTLAEAIRTGAVGYVLKHAEEDELVNVIRAAARGELLFGASIADLAKRLLHRQDGRWVPPLPELSERERSVLDLLAAGESVSRIAAMLHLSEKSVRNYLTAIPRRLGAADREEAVALARKAGLGRYSG